MDRRTFLVAMPAVATSRPAAADELKLAVDGGKPVRSVRLATEFPGTQFYDEQERTELDQAYDTHSLFRFYGPQQPLKVARFEQEFAALTGVKHVLAVTSGTAALHVALTALGVGPGDEVILPAWTWHSCYTTILMTGALPVFAEVDESLTIDPVDMEARITPQTKVIMAVHLFGSGANMTKIMEVARKHNLKVLEDTAQSCGAKLHGKRLGTFGDIGIYSFQLHR
jgi:8-amino-3,8-dideoxy-alpha-D-manno-octulosonate transaminase